MSFFIHPAAASGMRRPTGLNRLRGAEKIRIRRNQIMMQEWFRKAKLGIFIHYGIYAVGDVSESWSFHNGNISYEDYMKQCEGFTASKYDSRRHGR